MIHSKVIIIGGGPAGSSCAWRLNHYGIECLILDKQPFPRSKLCAGWITPQVIDDLSIDVSTYPHTLTSFSEFHIHLFNKEMTLKVQQYAIRRKEFDYWLLERSGVPIYLHTVQEIKHSRDHFQIDNLFCCSYLVGAGGTYCPVYRTFFKRSNPRPKNLLITTLEEEFPCDIQDYNCHLWFLYNKLSGYAWYVPKRDGYVNIGIGGYLEKLKSHHDSIANQWQCFTRELERISLVNGHRFNAKGYNYYIRNRTDSLQIDRIYLIGDAAGLATRDMGEGIGPAVRSGIAVADAIASGKRFSLSSVKKHSFPRYQTYVKLFAKFLLNE